MIRNALVIVATFLVAGCSGMIEDIKNMEITNVSFPAKEKYTLSCLDTAAGRRDYFLEKGDRIGVIDRYTLREVGGKPPVTLDV
ncbi:hypothetical protein GW574_22315 (plasmid) [Pantoea agglomerans]|uniref:hypothetical protein n=1 Tax=Enterobacter agglomerans TaxID=549 RepID=UPI00139781C0|nr:hypothetical protein [Pantoea agglomerans]QIA55065.1 hypothetical protein GW574_22315 [Pantoea agglomerans]